MKQEKMKHLGLFAGIGGFELAARWMGWETVAWCEWNEFCQKVLKYHFPEAEGHSDITKTDFTKYKNAIDIITGGFPCQPYSVTGSRLGKADERHLWPEMLRAVREVQPRYVVGENVRGLTNWNEGVVFDEVQADLESEGYEVLPFLLPACAVNAPHRRDRIWFIAYSASSRQSLSQVDGGVDEKGHLGVNGFSGSWVTPDTISQGLERGANAGNIGPGKKKSNKRIERLYDNSNWENFPTEPPVCDGNDGIYSRLDGITFPKLRTESIKAGGNAIVPQVAHQIFKAIEQFMKPESG